MVNIGERVKARRIKLGWSATKLAAVSGLNQSFISRVETGKSGYTAETLYKLAGALGISVDKLLATNSNVIDAPPDVRTIPVLDYVQAGKWMAVREHLADSEIQETISTSLDCPPSTFALRIRGESMEPEFRSGDIVIIAPTVQPQAGDFVVAVDDSGEATFKKYRDVGLNAKSQHVFELVALNPDYSSLRSDRQRIAIVGVMIEHRRFRRK